MIRKRLIAAGLLLLLSLTVILGLSSLVLEGIATEWIQYKFPKTFEMVKYAFWLLEKGIVLGIILLLLGIIYRFGPSTITKWNLFSPGSWIATLLFWITSSGFSYYVSHFSTYNKLYGSLGTLLIIMLWLYINSFVILVGFELNVAIYGNSRNHQRNPV
jgi:membrane protein